MIKHFVSRNPLLNAIGIFGVGAVSLLIGLGGCDDAEKSTSYPYICPNGVKADGTTDTADTQKCTSCASGYTLSNERCVETTSCTPLKVDATSDTARYKISLSITWTTAATGTPTLPGGAHFTTVTGTNHASTYTMWQSGTLASPGLEILAETGGTSALTAEINARISGGEAEQVMSLGSTGAVGTVEKEYTITAAYPHISLASMLAPSSDWFTGISGHSLIDASNNWKCDHSVEIKVYDAGTEDDDIPFSLGNREASPHVTISRLVGSSTIGFQPPKDTVGIIRFSRL